MIFLNNTKGEGPAWRCKEQPKQSLSDPQHPTPGVGAPSALRKALKETERGGGAFGKMVTDLHWHVDKTMS